MASAKLAVIRIRPAVRPSGQTYHTHGTSRKCECQEGRDATLQQAQLAVKEKEKSR